MKKGKRKTGIRITVISGIILVCFAIIALPFFKSNKEEGTYRELSAVMQSTFTRFQSADSASTWRYSEFCTNDSSKEISSGNITCKVEINLQRPVTNTSTVNRLQNTYYSIVNNSDSFTTIGSLNREPTKLFGKKFVVSGVERQYSLNRNNNIVCRYLLSLGQQSDNSANSTLGKPIEKNSGTIRINFTCSGPAANYWYNKQ